MSDKYDKLRLFGEIWDGLSTPQKWRVMLALAGSLVVAFSLGFWAGNLSSDNRVESVKAKYERQITELRIQQAEKTHTHELRLELE